MKLIPENYDTFPVNGWKTEICVKLTVLVLRDKDEYVCLLKPEGESYREMFSLPRKQQTMTEANNIAIANALKYAVMFDNENDENQEGANDNE